MTGGAFAGAKLQAHTSSSRPSDRRIEASSLLACGPGRWSIVCGRLKLRRMEALSALDESQCAPGQPEIIRRRSF